MAYPHPTYVARWLLRYGTDVERPSPRTRSATSFANRPRPSLAACASTFMLGVGSLPSALRVLTTRGVLACALAVAAFASTAAGTDLHRLWDDRCAECHEHAGDFARKHLVLVDGTLKGRSIERDLRQFLANHYPGDADVDDIHAMLLAQAGSEPRFRNECSSCHWSAADLAREALLRRDDALYGRSSNQRLDTFLLGHKGLGEDDVAFFVQLLERVERESHRP